ncbi:MAG: hypothetical protein JHC33_01685 [Ignisphaera sp.]|nr:hypothetical protein [Ignisphaera sp.]
MRISKGLALLIAVSMTMFFVGFAGGMFSAPSLGFKETVTVSRQVPILITQTVTVVNTTTVTSTVTTTHVETYTSTVTATTTETIAQTVFMPTTVTRTQTLTLTINMPAATPSTPFTRVSKGSSIKINDWAISVAMSNWRTVSNTSTIVVGNTTQVVTTNTTYFVVVLQLVNDAPWSRIINTSMLSKAVLVTANSRSYEPTAINASKNFIAPGSYGFAMIWFSIDKNESPSYLYTEIIVHGMPVRVEFEL